MILIKEIGVYGPDYLGIKDVLIGGSKILALGQGLELSGLARVIDGRGKFLVPGFIDHHVHITGGGGEAGFFSKAPEVKATDLIKGGITTVCGLLGTDGVSRSMENLISKTYGLREQGLSAYCFTGSYRYPSPSLTGDIEKDILFIEPVIGSKIAVSDHRSSQITRQELTRLAAETRIAGMCSRKKGTLIVHMGNGKRGLEPLLEVLENSDLPISIFHPTHCNRNPRLLEESYDYLARGGSVDYTCGINDNISFGEILSELKKRNLPRDLVTISSDGNGSWSNYDDTGRLVEIGIASVASLWEEISGLLDHGFSLDEVLPYVTSNVARVLGIENKGYIREDFDADLLILDGDYGLETVIAKGQIFLDQGKLIEGKILEF